MKIKYSRNDVKCIYIINSYFKLKKKKTITNNNKKRKLERNHSPKHKSLNYNAVDEITGE